MARVVILGAGISGHTAARYLNKWIGKNHEIVVVSPNARWNWIPSNIWVGVGQMTEQQVTFDLAEVYRKTHVDFRQAKGISIHPEGSADNAKPYVTIEYTRDDKAGRQENIEYDYLINATGPKLNFNATEGLGPEHGHTVSVCTAQHALEANHKLQQQIDAMRRGEHRTLVIGTGHGMCTCQGAAFEYIYNVDHVLREAGVRDKARIVWISNEYELGDFGMGGVNIKRGGYVTNGKTFAESLMVERGIEWIIRAHVKKVEAGKIHYEMLDGTFHELAFDFSMLIPPFAGVGLKAFNKAEEDITGQIFAPNGFMKVDADYTARPFAEWSAQDWPQDLPVAAVQEPVRGRHRVRAAAPDQQGHEEPQRHPDQPDPAAHRHALRRDGQGRGDEHTRHDQQRFGQADAHRLDGRDGRGLRRLHRLAPVQGNGRDDDRVPGRARLREISRVRPRHRPHLRRDRTGRALDEIAAALHLHLPGQTETGLVDITGLRNAITK